ncbi:MAG: sigma-70 family RNA polymerase sigma factor [Myxococcota bacterium]
MAVAYRRYYRQVLRQTIKIVGSAPVAEDIAHDVFMRFFEQIRSGQQHRNVGGYLIRAAINRGLNRIRDTERRRTLLALQSSPSAILPTQDAALTVHRLLSEVSPEEAEVAAFYFLDERDQAEIAALLGVSRRTVVRRIASFRAQALELLTAPLAASA